MTTDARRLEYVPLPEIVAADRNPKGHDEAVIGRSISRWGFIETPVIDERTGKLVAGHGRTDELRRRFTAGEDPPDGVENRDGVWYVPVVRGWASENDDEALAAGIALNRSTELGGWDYAELLPVLDDFAERGFEDGVDLLDGIGFDAAALDRMRAEFEAQTTGAVSGGGGTGDSTKLTESFLVPPFSIFDARQGYWQERKRSWLALGLRSDLGRPTNLLKMSDTVNDAMVRPSQPNHSMPRSIHAADPSFYWKKQAVEKQLGHPISSEEFIEHHYEADQYVAGTSVFDPVLCEIAYRWFTPEGGHVLDPFAGGSVRGLVASRLGRHYTGVDLSAAQVEANEQQLGIVRDGDPVPRWVVGDGRVAGTLVEQDVDFVFSCPPYFDLEQYSNDPSDLSNTGSFEAFAAALTESVVSSCSRLRPGRFACFVIGNVRAYGDGVGALYDLGDATVRAFAAAGLVFYNDAILITPGGSIALRARSIFKRRKLARTHQQVLFFVKPPLDDALEACGPVEIADPAAAFGETFDVDPTTEG